MDDAADGQGTSPDSQVDFASARLQPGAIVQIESLKKAGQKYSLRFVGIIKGKSVLLTLPVVGGNVVNMPPGHEYVIRGFNGKHAFAFTSKVIQARSRPFPYVHFSWPESVEAKTVRNTLRVNVNLPAVIEKDGQATPITLIDLSAKGSMIGADKPVGEVGNTVNVQFDILLDGMKKSMNVPATIRNAKYSKDANSIHVGVEFDGVSPDDTLRLNNFILTRTLEG